MTNVMSESEKTLSKDLPFYLNQLNAIFTNEIKLDEISEEEFFFTGTGFDGKKYLLIKINIEKKNSIDPNFRKYILNLQNFSHLNIVKYYGIYINEQNSSYYLTYELPAYSFYSFHNEFFHNLTTRDKFNLSSQILELFKYFYDREENNPLVRNWKFYFVDVNKDNTMTFKFLNVGRVLSIKEINNLVIDIPCIKEIYRLNLIDQIDFAKRYQYTDDTFLLRFYLDTFAKILLLTFTKNEKMNETVSVIKEVPIFINKFILLYTDPNAEEEFFKDDKGKIFDRAFQDFNTFIRNNFQFISPLLNTQRSQNGIRIQKICLTGERKPVVKEVVDITDESPEAKEKKEKKEKVINKKEKVIDKKEKVINKKEKVINKKRKRENTSDDNIVDLTLDEINEDNSSSEITSSDKSLFINLLEKDPVKGPIVLEEKSSINTTSVNNESVSSKTDKTDERLKFMEKNFPVTQKEFFTYFKKPFNEFMSLAIISSSLPKAQGFNIPKNYQNPTVKDLVKPNYNININMTNFIINNDNNKCIQTCCNQSSQILDKINNNICNSISKKKESSIDLLSSRKLWSNKVLPESEVEGLINEVKRIWPYQKVCCIYEDMIIIFLALCEYDVFKTIGHVEKSSDFFINFCKKYGLVKSTSKSNEKTKRTSYKVKVPFTNKKRKVSDSNSKIISK